MKENPYKAPAQDHAPIVPVGGCLAATRQFSFGFLVGAVLVAIGVVCCIATYYTTSRLSDDYP